MFAFIVRRVFVGVVMLFVMSLVTFLLFFASPADPARFTCGKNCSPALIEQNRKALGFDQPVLVQWGNFVRGIFVGREFPNDPELKRSAPETIAECPAPCLGYSPQSSANVTDILKQKIPVSASLALAAFIMWILGGVGGGIIAALRKGKFADKIIVGAALIVYAFPTFFIGLFLLQYVALKWQLTPYPVYTPLASNPIAWALGLFLPGLTLALFYMAGYVRLTRAFVLESLSEDYLRTARAKGVPRRTILFKHTMRAALTPLATIAGLDLANVLGGAIITENVFNYDGLGKLAVQAATTYDLPVTVGIVVLLAAFVITANIIVDVLYAVIDPRVKVS
ncbi:peptide/nickel transport system permease protein [Kineosphaera limosa]|uniref:Putative peptide ABC transporter permease protein n=1 Tax=Kineosphaera limosa NBRC 100340 TaxID=1184609 RepID=K6WWA4_9MICO|nr:ABC transporter permease [Kineosphaera limosa]NYD99193.1 peptide/nickel transport system permease protein [Kineosphaera limosa]GAB96357.1 putative peptide ABC transporter permease protein [Kineosphaera limosa NBRC 100340]